MSGTRQSPGFCCARTLSRPNWLVEAAASAEECIIRRLHVVPHRRGFKISRAWFQMPLHFIVVERDAQAGGIRNLNIPLVDDRLLNACDQVLPPRHIE